MMEVENENTPPVKNVTRKYGLIFHPTLGYAIPPPIPLTIARRNALERNRVKTVNDIYECLRAHVPAAAKAKRMSKVDIIRHTIDYIEKLKELVSTCEAEQAGIERISSVPDLSAESLTCPSFSNVSPGWESDSGYGSPGGQFFQFPPARLQDLQHYNSQETNKKLVTQMSQNNINSSWQEQSNILQDSDILDVIAEWQDS